MMIPLKSVSYSKINTCLSDDSGVYCVTPVLVTTIRHLRPAQISLYIANLNSASSMGKPGEGITDASRILMDGVRF